MTAMTCVLMLVAVPAMGAGLKAHEDCDADDPDRNIAGCTRIIEDDAEGDTMHAVAYVARGLAWQAKGNLDHALADYTDAIRLNPRDALTYNNRGLLWREKGDADRAIADLDEAIRLDPSRAYDHYMRGVVRYDRYMGFMGGGWIEKEDLKQAIADFTEAIRLDAKNASSHYARALAWNTDGDRDRAVADLTEAVRLAPDNQQFTAALKQLKP
jgi:tetratricopeptide (TPR) repeat protein